MVCEKGHLFHEADLEASEVREKKGRKKKGKGEEASHVVHKFPSLGRGHPNREGGKKKRQGRRKAALEGKKKKKKKGERVRVT